MKWAREKDCFVIVADESSRSRRCLSLSRCYAALTRHCKHDERLESSLQFGAVVLLNEGAKDDQNYSVDDALLAQERRSSVVSRRGLNDLRESRSLSCSIASRSVTCMSLLLKSVLFPSARSTDRYAPHKKRFTTKTRTP